MLSPAIPHLGGLGNYPIVLAHSNTPRTVNSVNGAADTVYKILDSLVLPQYLLMYKESLRCHARISVTSSASTKTAGFKLAGTSTGVRSFTTVANGQFYQQMDAVHPAGQKFLSNPAVGLHGDSNGVQASANANFGAGSVILTFEAVWGAPVAGESITLESWDIEYRPGVP